MADVRLSLIRGGIVLRRIFSPENLVAFLLCLILITIVIASADQAPQWIYQGF